MKFQKKYEDPRRIYLKVNETTESKEIMQKPYLVGFRMNDKERVKDLLVDIDSFLVEKGGDEVIVNWDGRTPRDLLKLIKRDLEK